MTAPRSDTAVAERAQAGARLRRPDGSLLTYYVLISLVTGPAFPFVFLYYYFRYQSLRYEFDDEGVTMRWGILFRREISLTYARIQDIHLTSNVVERWLGLARVQVQTASGNAGAEMTIEGLKDFETIRDELYSRMRGVKGGGSTAVAAATRGAAGGRTGSARVGDDGGSISAGGSSVAGDTSLAAGGSIAAGELAAALQEAARELRQLRQALAESGIVAGGGRDHV